jgi:hypothetical protein
MSKQHHSTQVRVSNDTANSNFEAGTALENLRAEFIDIEALARAAEAAADGLPAPATDRQRLVFGRIQSLATKVSEQAGASLRFANAQVAALTAQMEARRKASGCRRRAARFAVQSVYRDGIDAASRTQLSGRRHRGRVGGRSRRDRP